MPTNYGPDGLTDRERVFCQEYLKDFNASRAARDAGYAPKTVNRQAHQLLQRPRVQKQLEKLKAEVTKRNNIEIDDVLGELRNLAFYDARKLFDDAGQPIPISELDDDVACCIVGLDAVTLGNKEQGLGEVVKYKLADKLRALELAGKYLKMWTDRMEATVTEKQSLDSLAAKARQRKAQDGSA